MAKCSDEKAIFHTAASFTDAAQRSAYLDVACQGDPSLRMQVESLLCAHDSASGFLRPAPPDHGVTIGTSEVLEGPGTTIDRYKLLQEIGQGGFGVVYMAEQVKPVSRRVALKVIKLGMDTKQVIGRFEAERQALAMMDHPNIARVFDAGATETGRPYFVMELVRGMPITEFCDENRLNTQQRLALFIDVCHAVQHAHQKGIIHRDLKPSNVLVTLHDDRPVPKVIDFGVAKATQHRLTERTVFTEFKQFIGTPMYMSPEQAALSGLDVDTRTDVYSLGVLLYELLTGSTPYDMKRLREAGYDELRRIIREEEPPRPSTKITTLGQQASTISARRRIDPRQLGQLLRGELDWIVMRALEKDRMRRYESASSFARDVERFLHNEPIEARPPSAGYRFHKFAVRNRPILLSATILAGALLLGTLVSTWLAIRETVARREADAEQERAVAAEFAARHAQTRAETALADSRWSQAELALDKGQLLGEQGDANLALLWMARALKTVPEDASDLRRAIRINLAAWSQQLNPLRLVLPLEGRVDQVAFAPNGQTVLTAALVGNEGFVLQRWDPRTGLRVHPPIRGVGRMVTSVAFDEKATTLAVGYATGVVEFVNLATASVQQLGYLQPGPVTCLEFSPQGDQILVAHGEGAVTETSELDENSHQMQGPGLVQLVDLPSEKPRFAQPLKHQHLVWAAAFTPVGDSFATESGEWFDALSKAEARFWNLSGEQIHPPLAHPDPALCIRFTPDGKKLLSGHWDFRARLWDLSAEEDAPPELVMPCDGPVGAVAFHPHDAKIVLLNSFGGTARLWDLDARSPKGPPLWHQNLIRCACFSPDGRYVMTGTRASARLWEVGLPDPDQYLPSFRTVLFPVAIDHASGHVLAHDEDGMIRLRDSATGRALGKPISYAGPVLTGAFNRAGTHAALIGIDNSTRIWNLETGELLRTLKYSERAFCVEFSPGGETVATGHFGDVAIFWDPRTGEEKDRIKHEQHSGPVFAIDYSSDGQRILTGGADSRVRLWDTRTRTQVNVFRQLTFASGACFSPDDSKVISCGSGEGARIWDVATGEPIGLPLRHQGMVSSAKFSRDGSIALTGGMDRTARLWDVATGKQLGPSLWHSDRVVQVDFWPDGKTIVTSESSGDSASSALTEARYWPLPRPIQRSDQDVELWVQTITGLELDEKGGVRLLEPDQWKTRHRQLLPAVGETK